MVVMVGVTMNYNAILHVGKMLMSQIISFISEPSEDIMKEEIILQLDY